MKPAPIATARIPASVAAVMRSMSSSERSVKMRLSSMPGIGGRIGDAPGESISLS